VVNFGSPKGLQVTIPILFCAEPDSSHLKNISRDYYLIDDLHKTLNEFAGRDFGDNFFNNFIFKSKIPNYESLFNSVGVSLVRKSETPYFGSRVTFNAKNQAVIQSNLKIGSPAYKAGLDKGDIITAINGTTFKNDASFGDFIKAFKVGDTLKIVFERFGVEKSTSLVLEENPNYLIFLNEKKGPLPSEQVLKKRKAWLKSE